ncbi:hypothetical protein F8M41_016113 [Gigaspora margarita]|uniref:Uncharacterized protein n=1 Tax=Gigaspora margarita TaxID=4874 RepID=A0A8H4EMT1_GIGMA|nr:hypothetical protein F8M41_016113 [Gigaspora margarita]
MKDLQLVDFKELELHLFENYADALKMIINVSLLNNYLNQNVIPIITDWPGQLFIRKIITYLKIQQSVTNILQVYKNFHPIISLLHVLFFQIFYWTDNNHPFNKSIKSFLVHFNNYYVENVHSRTRAYTTKYSTTDKIIKEAFVIAEVLICGHGYYIICYNAMKGRCKYCYNYYETGIKNNVKSFINRLEKEANILTENDIDIDNNKNNENKNNNNNNNNDDDEVKNLNLVLSEKDKIEQEFTDKLVNVLNW